MQHVIKNQSCDWTVENTVLLSTVYPKENILSENQPVFFGSRYQ